MGSEDTPEQPSMWSLDFVISERHLRAVLGCALWLSDCPHTPSMEPSWSAASPRQHHGLRGHRVVGFSVAKR